MNEVVETWNSIIEKYQEAKNGTLKAEELIVFRVFAFLIRVEMNDVSGALYNLSPKLGSDQSSWNDLRATANAVNSIGDNQSAQLLLEAADIFEKLPEPLPSTWEEFMNLATSQLSEDFWQRIDSRISNIYDSLETYTVAHLLSQDHR
jgi:hypothetical protein